MKLIRKLLKDSMQNDLHKKIKVKSEKMKINRRNDLKSGEDRYVDDFY